MEYLVEILEAIAWPIIALIALLKLKQPLESLLGRIKAVEGPGDFKINLGEDDVKKIIEEGEQNKEGPDIIAQRIMQIIDKRETRIMRALLDDPGRKIYNYQTAYYKDALDSLIEKGYVIRYKNGFALSDQGFDVTKTYLYSILANKNG